DLIAIALPPVIGPWCCGTSVEVDRGAREQAVEPAIPEVTRRHARNLKRFMALVIVRIGYDKIDQRLEGCARLFLCHSLEDHTNLQAVVRIRPNLLAPMRIAEVGGIELDEAGQ